MNMDPNRRFPSRGDTTHQSDMSLDESFNEDSLESSHGDERLQLMELNQALTEEVKKHKAEVAAMKARMNEMRHLEENPNVAIRQIRAVERRLKVTEERLQKERKDRASKLSDIEEKLISDNSRLTVAESELKRKLARDGNRIASLEKRVRDLRDENESLSIALLEKPQSVLSVINEDGSINKLPLEENIPEYRKLSDDWNKLIKIIIEEEGDISLEEIIHRLWYQKDAVLKQLVIWDNQLTVLGADRNDITNSLKILELQRSALEQKVQALEIELQDKDTERKQAEGAYNDRLSCILKEKHALEAHNETLRDTMSSVAAERDCLAGGGTLKENVTNIALVPPGPVTNLAANMSMCSNLMAGTVSNVAMGSYTDMPQALTATQVGMAEIIGTVPGAVSHVSAHSVRGPRLARAAKRVLTARKVGASLTGLTEASEISLQAGAATYMTSAEGLTSEQLNTAGVMFPAAVGTSAQMGGLLSTTIAQGAVASQVSSAVMMGDVQGSHATQVGSAAMIPAAQSGASAQIGSAGIVQSAMSGVAGQVGSVKIVPRAQGAVSSYTAGEPTTNSRVIAPPLGRSASLGPGAMIEKREGSSQAIDEQISNLNQDLETNKKKMQFLKEENKRRQDELLFLQKELTTRIKDLKLSNEMNQKLTKDKAEFKRKSEDLEKLLQKLREESEMKSKDFSDLNLKYSKLEGDFSDSKMNLEMKVNEYNKSDATVMEMKQLLKYKEIEVDELSCKVNDLSVRVESADAVRESEIRNLREEDFSVISALQTEIADLKIKLAISEENTIAYREEKQKLFNKIQNMTGSGGDMAVSRFGPTAEDQSEHQALIDKVVETEAALCRLQYENSRLKVVIRKMEGSIQDDEEKDVDTIFRRLSSYEKCDIGPGIRNVDLQDTIDKMKRERELAECRYAKTLASLRSAELSLSGEKETREQMRTSLSELEEAVDLLKSQVSRETAARKQAELRVDGLVMEVQDKSISEDRAALHKANLAKAETDLVVERQTIDQLNVDVSRLEARNSAYETELKSLRRKLKEKTLQCETLQEQLANTKKDYEASIANSSVRFSTKFTELEQTERRKDSEVKQLKIELKTALDKVSNKGDEILQRKEEILNLEARLNSARRQIAVPSTNQAQQVSEAWKVMEDIQDLRAEKEDLVRSIHETKLRLKSDTEFVARSSPSSPNKKRYTTSNTTCHSHGELTMKLEDLEAKLRTEKAMHTVTQKQLKNIWSDNDSLRQRLVDAKRGPATSDVITNVSGRNGINGSNRMDEINEIIARSQGQVRLMGMDNMMAPNGVCSPNFADALSRRNSGMKLE